MPPGRRASQARVPAFGGPAGSGAAPTGAGAPGPWPQGSPGPAAGGPTCRVCGEAPALAVTVRGHQGLVVLMRFQRNSGPFCRPCGTAVVREMSAKTLVQGWWGIASVFVTPVTLLMNLVTSRRLKSLPPPGPATPRPPLDPGMPLLRRPQALGLALPLILVVIIVAAVLAGRDDARNAKAGGLRAPDRERCGRDRGLYVAAGPVPCAQPDQREPPLAVHVEPGCRGLIHGDRRILRLHALSGTGALMPAGITAGRATSG